MRTMNALAESGRRRLVHRFSGWNSEKAAGTMFPGCKQELPAFFFVSRRRTMKKAVRHGINEENKKKRRETLKKRTVREEERSRR